MDRLLELSEQEKAYNRRAFEHNGKTKEVENLLPYKNDALINLANYVGFLLGRCG